MNYKSIAALMAVSVLAVGTVRAEEAEKDWSIEVGGDYFSKYVFRGVEVSDKAMFSPHVIAGWKWFSASWYAYASDWDVAGNKRYWENNFTFDGTITLGKFGLTAGVLFYEYPDDKDGLDTTELYGIVTYDFPLLNPKLSWYYDIDEFKASYVNLSISHDFDLSKSVGLEEGTLTLTPSAAVAVEFNAASKYTTKRNVDWNDALFGVSLNWSVTKYISVHGGVQLAVPLGELDKALPHDERWIGNVGITLAF